MSLWSLELGREAREWEFMSCLDFCIPFLSCLWPVTHWGTISHVRWVLSWSASGRYKSKAGTVGTRPACSVEEGALKGRRGLGNPQFPWNCPMGVKGLRSGAVNFYQLGNWSHGRGQWSLRTFSEVIRCIFSFFGRPDSSKGNSCRG